MNKKEAMLEILKGHTVQKCEACGNYMKPGDINSIIFICDSCNKWWIQNE